MIKIQRLASISCRTDQNNSKLQKRSNYNVLHRFEVKMIRNVELRRKTFERTLNYKSYQNTTICIDLMSKQSKQRKTTKVIKLKCIALIWRQNDQKCCVSSQNIRKNAKLQKWSKFASISCQNDQNNWKLQKRANYNELHRFDVITINNDELRRNAFKTTQNYKSNQLTMTCIDLMSKHWKQP